MELRTPRGRCALKSRGGADRSVGFALSDNKTELLLHDADGRHTPRVPPPPLDGPEEEDGRRRSVQPRLSRVDVCPPSKSDTSLTDPSRVVTASGS